MPSSGGAVRVTSFVMSPAALLVEVLVEPAPKRPDMTFVGWPRQRAHKIETRCGRVRDCAAAGILEHPNQYIKIARQTRKG